MENKHLNWLNAACAVDSVWLRKGEGVSTAPARMAGPTHLNRLELMEPVFL